MNGALAIFCKTPGVSAVKTRLAVSVGESAAQDFYRRCLHIMESVGQEVAGLSGGLIQSYWAVGEPHTLDLPLWNGLRRLYTGGGGLDRRMHHVYSQLLEKHDFVILVGSDTPQITADLIIGAANHIIRTDEFVLGPALDGGFYLLGGSREITLDQFMSVPISSSITEHSMVNQLLKTASVRKLKHLTDVDTIDDVPVLLEELRDSARRDQQQLALWLQKNKWINDLPSEVEVDLHKQQDGYERKI